MTFDPMQLIAWGEFLVFVVGMLFFDLFVLHREEREIKFRGGGGGGGGCRFCWQRSVYQGWFILRMSITGWGWGWCRRRYRNDPVESAYYPADGSSAAILYLTGYLVEIWMSADNVFLFVVLLRYFTVPAELQHRVLFWGVLGALAMRAFMIVIGGTLRDGV